MWKPVLAAFVLLALLGCGEEGPEKSLKEGLIRYKQQDYAGAIENLEKAVSAGAKSPDAFNMLGLAYRAQYQKQQDPKLQESEIISFQKAVTIDPQYWEAMINLGYAYHDRGDKAQAAIWFKKALALNPNPPERADIEQLLASGSKKRRGR